MESILKNPAITSIDTIHKIVARSTKVIADVFILFRKPLASLLEYLPNKYADFWEIVVDRPFRGIEIIVKSEVNKLMTPNSSKLKVRPRYALKAKFKIFTINDDATSRNPPHHYVAIFFECEININFKQTQSSKNWNNRKFNGVIKNWLRFCY